MHLLSRATVLVSVLFCSVTVAGFSTLSSAENLDPAQRSVSVQGEAERRVAPDMATLRMEVLTENIDASEAREEADAITSRALKALRQTGIRDSDIDTTGLSVSPQYRWLKGEQRQQLISYRVGRSIEVRILELEDLGEILETLTDTGVNSVSPPRLGLQDRESLHREVLAAAAENARQRAAVIATALGAELGPVVSARTEMPQFPTPMRQERVMAMAADSAASTASESYNAGDLNYRATVHATFSLR